MLITLINVYEIHTNALLDVSLDTVDWQESVKKVTINTFHDHAPDNARIQKYVLKQEMLCLSRETLQAPKDIFDNVFRRNPESAAFIAFKSIRSQLNRERKKSIPKLPQSIAMLADELNNYIAINHIYKGSLSANPANTDI
ncbi:hypothetical protein ACS0PU_013216 [Formica fusca]